MELVKTIITHGPEIISALVGLLSALIAVACLIPGDEPEKTLSKVLEVIKKLSAKHVAKADEVKSESAE